MMLLFLDTNPEHAANMLIRSMGSLYAFKQLIELCQLICSAGISNEYKRIHQGKKLQEWVKEYPHWTLEFMKTLYENSFTHLNLSPETVMAVTKIYDDLLEYCEGKEEKTSSYVIFRYKKGYTGTILETDSEISAIIATIEYRKYLEWKKKEITDKIRKKKLKEK